MELLTLVLSPISMAMAALLEVMYSVVGSYGLSIVLLSVIVRLLLMPLTQWAQRIEAAETATQAAMAPQIKDAKTQYSGRERFEKIDAIYTAHGYHPIFALKSLSALALQIPFLLAALFLLSDYPALQGIGFGPIGDLGRSDALLSIGNVTINVLPIILTLVAISEAFYNDKATSTSRMKFIFVAFIVLILIYGFPAAVSLYWLTSNIFSFFVQTFRAE